MMSRRVISYPCAPSYRPCSATIRLGTPAFPGWPGVVPAAASDPPVPAVRVEVLKIVSTDFPGWVECRFVEAAGTEWRFVEKVPVVLRDDEMAKRE